MHRRGHLKPGLTPLWSASQGALETNADEEGEQGGRVGLDGDEGGAQGDRDSQWEISTMRQLMCGMNCELRTSRYLETW